MTTTTVNPWPSLEASTKAKAPKTPLAATKDYWLKQHNKAVHAPAGQEIGIVSALNGWQLYAALCNGQLGEDGVLGDAWLRAGKCLQELLNGELGRLDGGTLDHYIRATMKRAGFNDHEID